MTHPVIYTQINSEKCPLNNSYNMHLFVKKQYNMHLVPDLNYEGGISYNNIPLQF